MKPVIVKKMWPAYIPMPPLLTAPVVSEACSSYFFDTLLIIAITFFLFHAVICEFLFEGACRLNTGTSKRVVIFF